MPLTRKLSSHLFALTAAAVLSSLFSPSLMASGPLANEKSLSNHEPIPGVPTRSVVHDRDKQSADQRQLFLDAEEALRNGDTKTFESYRKRLEDYPLAPYLSLRELQRRLFSAETDEVVSVLEQYSDIPHSETLRQQWLTHLGRSGQWQALRDHARAPLYGQRLQCLVLRAELLDDSGSLRSNGGTTEASERALDEAVADFWVTGHSLPGACDPLLSAWRSQGGLTDDRVWQRMKAAAENHNEGLVRYLQRYLSADFRQHGDALLAVHREPKKIADYQRYKDQDAVTQDIILHAIGRLIRTDPETAEPIWRQYSESHEFDARARQGIDRLLGLRLAVRYDEKALPWLKRASVTDREPTLYEWQARVHMRNGNWQALLEVIQAMPEDLASTSRWQYWQARGEETLRDYTRANSRYLEVAGNRDFYGFLAADHMGLPYALNQRGFVADLDEVAQLNAKPGIQRARELHKLGRLHHARREWLRSLSGADQQQLLTAAQLANHWGWHERAVMATISARAWDQLDLRFPLAYQEKFSASAQQHNVDVNWVFAMARQESAFMEDARSHKGAMGLLQLLPGTAGATASKHALAFNGQQSLLDPAVNIPLGTAHLAELLESFQGNRLLATAAYNAGEHRVRTWLNNGAESLATDVWLETMPYYETRQYVQNIMAYTIIYSDRRGYPVAGLLTQQELACACIE